MHINAYIYNNMNLKGESSMEIYPVKKNLLKETTKKRIVTSEAI